MIMSVRTQLHAGNLCGSLTDAISLESISLFIPLTNSGGVGILLHVVVIAQLTLGLNALGNGDNALSNSSLSLNNIDGDSNDLALSIQSQCNSSNISLSLSRTLVLSIGACLLYTSPSTRD